MADPLREPGFHFINAQPVALVATKHLLSAPRHSFVFRVSDFVMTPLKADDIRLACYSICDNNSYLNSGELQESDTLVVERSNVAVSDV